MATQSREEARRAHSEQTGHQQYSESVYGVICADCRNYILIDHTNCSESCREHETCRQAYA